MATTHLEPLKAFASTHPGARNASGGIRRRHPDADVPAPLRPPGPELRARHRGALRAGPRAGGPRPHAPVGPGRPDVRAARAPRCQARSDAERTIALERREREATARLEAARHAETSAEARAQTIVERARRDAAALVTDIRRALTVEWDRLKTGERTPQIDRPEPPARGPGRRATGPGDPARWRRPGRRAGPRGHRGRRASRRPRRGGHAHRGHGDRAIGTHHLAHPGAGPARGGGRSGPFRGRTSRRREHPEKTGVAPELHLIGRTTDEARDLVEHYLDDAFVAGLATVRVVHGKGTGPCARRCAISWPRIRYVESFRRGPAVRRRRRRHRGTCGWVRAMATDYRARPTRSAPTSTSSN